MCHTEVHFIGIYMKTCRSVSAIQRCPLFGGFTVYKKWVTHFTKHFDSNRDRFQINKKIPHSICNYDMHTGCQECEKTFIILYIPTSSVQGCQVSRNRRETHGFWLHLTVSREDGEISRILKIFCLNIIFVVSSILQ